MAKVETAYWDNSKEKVTLAYSIDGVYWLSVLFKILGILSLVGALPSILIGLICLLDSPTNPVLGWWTLLGGTVGAVVGFVFWSGLANTLCLLIDLKGTLERQDGQQPRRTAQAQDREKE